MKHVAVTWAIQRLHACVDASIDLVYRFDLQTGATQRFDQKLDNRAIIFQSLFYSPKSIYPLLRPSIGHGSYGQSPDIR